jgi:hypothetical protein
MKYQASIQFDFDAIDDVDARREVIRLLRSKFEGADWDLVEELQMPLDVRLREVFPNRPPRTVAM